MRKDIFVVGVRLLGVWQLVGAVVSLCNIIFVWLGYYKAQSIQSEYTIIHFGVQLVIGLYLILRPYHLFHFIERFAEKDDKEQEEPDAK